MNKPQKIPVIIRAGAGTGKTHFLMETLIYLMNKHHSSCSDKICNNAPVLAKTALITYTENAASMMKSRLMSLIDLNIFTGKEGINPLCFFTEKEALYNSSITTIHSFCRKEVLPFMCENGWDIGLDVLEDEKTFLKKTFIAFLNGNFNNNKNIPSVLSMNLNYLIDIAADIYMQSRALGITEMEFIDCLIQDIKDRADIISLLSLVKGFSDFVYEEKKRLSVWSYDDMVRFMYDALMKEDFNECIRERYDHILIDEFQDTDPLQLKIALILSSKWGTSTPDFKGLQIDPDRLLVVGDKRQSIYGFRNASSRITDYFYNKVKKQGLCEKTLSVNFRSSPSLLELVNSIFSRGLKDDYIPLSPSENNLDCIIRSALYRLDSDKKYGIDEIRRLEADGIKYIINVLLANGIPYGDIVVLVRDKLSLTSIEVSFRNSGIPFFVFKKHGFTHNPVIWDLISILMASINKTSVHTDTIKRLPFSVSDWSALFDDLSKVQVNKGLSSALRFLIERLNLIKSMPVSSWDSNSFWINVEKLFSLIIQKEEQGTSSIQILNYIMEMPEDSDVGKEVQPAGDFSNMVRVMTIHSAKGLEFPYVFVAGIQKEKSRGYNKVLSDLNEDRLFTGLKFDDDESDGYKELKSIKNEDKYNEYLNLMYVAFTRAKKAFFAFPAFYKKNESFMDILISLSKPFPVSSHAEKKESLLNLPTGRSKQAALPFYPPYNISIGKIVEMFTDKKADKPDKSGINIGSLIHKLIEIFPTRHDGWKEQASRLAGVYDLSEIPYEIINNTYDIMDNIFESYKPRRALREYPLYAKIASKHLIIHGICDMLFECPDMLIVADIKTGKPYESHKLQVGLYGWILNKSRKCDIMCMILYPALDKEQIVTCKSLSDEEAFHLINAALVKEVNKG